MRACGVWAAVAPYRGTCRNSLRRRLLWTLIVACHAGSRGFETRRPRQLPAKRSTYTVQMFLRPPAGRLEVLSSTQRTVRNIQEFRRVPEESISLATIQRPIMSASSKWRASPNRSCAAASARIANALLPPVAPSSTRQKPVAGHMLGAVNPSRRISPARPCLGAADR